VGALRNELTSPSPMQALLTTWPGGWCGAVEFVAILIAHLSAEAHPRALALRVVITHKNIKTPGDFHLLCPSIAPTDKGSRDERNVTSLKPFVFTQRGGNAHLCVCVPAPTHRAVVPPAHLDTRKYSALPSGRPRAHHLVSSNSPLAREQPARQAGQPERRLAGQSSRTLELVSSAAVSPGS
jgi:hypothetical protein